MHLPYFRYMATPYILLISIFVALIFVALFSGIEMAFISANRLGIELKKKQGKSSGRIMSGLMEHPSKFLGGNLVGFNFFLVIYGLLVSTLIKTSFWIPIVHTENPYLKLILVIAVVWLVFLFIGEFLPKAIFK